MMRVIRQKVRGCERFDSHALMQLWHAYGTTDTMWIRSGLGQGMPE